VVHPIEYTWCLGGYALSGHGTVALGESSIAYSVDRSHCELTIEAGGSLDTELAVSATDAYGTELLARRTVSVNGRERYCHYEGVEQIEGPPPELSQPGTYLAGQAYGPGLPTDSATEAISRGGFDMAVRVALKQGMGVDPTDPSVRRPEAG
jgi:hypothetical protein